LIFRATFSYNFPCEKIPWLPWISWGIRIISFLIRHLAGHAFDAHTDIRSAGSDLDLEKDNRTPISSPCLSKTARN